LTLSFDENKLFETCLATHFHEPDRWNKIAATFTLSGTRSLSGLDAQREFERLEEDILCIREGKGLVVITQRNKSSKSKLKSPTKKAKTEGSSVHPEGPTGRKGIPWTQEEHHAFLVGLAQCGKGSWRNISKEYVITRTPTQVASHAQKYFLRLTLTNDRRKARASIHDMTMSHLRTSHASSGMHFEDSF